MKKIFSNNLFSFTGEARKNFKQGSEGTPVREGETLVGSSNENKLTTNRLDALKEATHMGEKELKNIKNRYPNDLKVAELLEKIDSAGSDGYKLLAEAELRDYIFKMENRLSANLQQAYDNLAKVIQSLFNEEDDLIKALTEEADGIFTSEKDVEREYINAVMGMNLFGGNDLVMVDNVATFLDAMDAPSLNDFYEKYPNIKEMCIKLKKAFQYEARQYNIYWPTNGNALEEE